MAGGAGPSGPGVRFIRPLRDFLAAEAAGGAVLLVAAAVALVWANSPWKASYNDLWTTRLSIGLGDHVLALDLRHWVNEGLMTVFFFVVGLEIKRELVEGELRQPRQAALPAIAAVGGMVVPAVIYALINLDGAGSRGWAIPMSTDIAIAVGVLSLLGRRASPGLKLFVLAVAIVDDIGAIAVIAVFYGGGVSAAILGAVLGLLVPARRRRPGAASMAERLEHAFHPWSSFVVIPIFALANAGIGVSVSALRDAGSSSVSLGVVLGLVIGKFIGVLGASWLAIRVGIGTVPGDVRMRDLLGGAAVCGIGFTVSIFVAGLAFTDAHLIEQAKVGILAASVVSAVVGAAILWRAQPT